MNLDAEFHQTLDAIFDDEAHRAHVKALLASLPEPEHGLVCSREIIGIGTIGSNILVITAKAISYGWPHGTTIWRAADVRS